MRNDNPSKEITDEQLRQAIADPVRRERLVFADEQLCNEVIARYLTELAATPAVPTLRGFAALSPLPKPRTLSEAKDIVDGNR